MYNTTKALVLREVRYKEADRMLSLMTEKYGLITAKARGALRKTSKASAATQQLCWSELTLFGNKGRWSVNEGTVLESFEGLKYDIAAFSLGCYFAQLTEALAAEDEPDGELLSLCLNSLYALSRNLRPQEQIKAAFELRLMCLAGYEPDLRYCLSCGCENPESPLLLVSGGSVCCRSCKTRDMGESAALSADSLKAMRFIVNAPPKKFLSFALPEGEIKILGNAVEKYTLNHMGRSFKTLDYWKSVK